MNTSERLFREVGVSLGELAQIVIGQMRGTVYRIMEHDRFTALSPAQTAQVYWTEMLYRSHWAASSNLVRHQRWFTACLALLQPNPNFIGFAAVLRGLVEASADSVHCLRNVPLTLAMINGPIRASLAGKSSSMALCQELEDQLIHFQFARRLKKGEGPDSHRAKSARDYLASVDSPDGKLAALYSELCEVVHSAATSLLWASCADGEQVRVSAGDDGAWIEDLCSRHADAVQASLMHGVNASILVLKLLNRFPLEIVHTPALDRWQLGEIPGWGRIEAAWLNGANETA